MIGLTFGRWKVLGAKQVADKHWHCICVCECGTERTVAAYALRRGKTISCGCWRNEQFSIQKRTHGKTKTSEYNIWTKMIFRCHNETCKQWSIYGGRGISVCDRWRKSFVDFLEDMGPRPSPRHTIDRINGDGNYEPSNCRWATWIEQENNRRNNRKFSFRGQFVTASEASRMAGGIVPPTLATQRVLCQGWSVEKAVTTPKQVQDHDSDGKFIYSSDLSNAS